MKDSGRGAVVMMRILDIFVDFLDHTQGRGNSRVQVEHIGIYLMSVLLLDRLQAIPQCLRGELGFVAALDTMNICGFFHLFINPHSYILKTVYKLVRAYILHSISGIYAV